jgi:hypothetical protein
MGNSCCKKDYHKKNRPSNDSNAPAADLSKVSQCVAIDQQLEHRSPNLVVHVVPFFSPFSDLPSHCQPQSLDANDIAAAQAAIDEEEAEALSTDAEEVLASSFVVNLVQDPVKAGEILKRSEWKKEWKRRFLVLKNGHLYSCKDANTNPNNILFLNPRTDVVHADSQNISEKNKRVMGERTGSFKVTDDKGQSFYLAPVSPDTMGFNDWVHVLETTIENMKQLERYKEALLPKLQRGTTFVKKNFSTLGALSTRDQHRVVSVSADCRSVLWHKPEVAEFDDIPFDEITNIVSGAETPVFKRQRKSVREVRRAMGWGFASQTFVFGASFFVVETLAPHSSPPPLSLSLSRSFLSVIALGHYCHSSMWPAASPS